MFSPYQLSSDCKNYPPEGAVLYEVAQSFSRFICQWRAAKVCVNDDSSSVDDWLKLAGAEFLELAADKIDNRSEFGNLVLRANPRKFLPDDGDDEGPGKIDFS